MKILLLSCTLLVSIAAFAAGHQRTVGDESGRVLALEKAWNRAL